MIHQRLHCSRRFGAVCAVTLALAVVVAAPAQTSRWADKDDPTANSMIALEHQWTDADCTGSLIVETLLAEDFHGISPDGIPYSKQEALERAKNMKQLARSCLTYEVKVHFFGDSIALLYGSESAVWKISGGKERTRKLVWTDTWLKRNGKWQIVAAEDMPVEAK
jgi:Domain of unknown function (DUF4440)